MLITDPATGGISGVHLMEVLNKLGIAEEMKDKLVPNRGSGHHAERVVKGEADLAVQAEHEIRCVPGAAFLDYPKESAALDRVHRRRRRGDDRRRRRQGLSDVRHRARGRAGDQGEVPVAGLSRQVLQETHSRGETMTPMRFIAAALAAAFTLAAGTAQAQVRTEWIEYAHGGTKLKGYLAYDDKIKGKRPAILMIHDRAGMQPYAQKQAENWARLGYVTFAADFFGYGQGILPKDVPEAVAQMGIYTKDRALMKARAQAGYDTLIKNPMVDASRVALIGYCFGGMVGVEFGSTGVPLAANVAIHGSFADHPEGWAKNAKGKFLILHGAEDVPYPLEKVALVYNELRKAKVDFQMEFYSGAGHGFSVPKNKAEERANTQSIAATTRFLREIFGD